MEKKRLLEFRMPGTGKLLSFKNKQYYVTNDGQIWNEELKRFLKQRELNGYLVVDLFTDDGKHHSGIRVHDLVASCFIRLLEKGENCHHLNHVRSDNRLENLQIIDGGEHSRKHNYEKWRNGTMEGVGEKVAAKCSKQVAQINKDGNLIKIWPSTRECQRNGFDHTLISRCCSGEKKTHHGFRWMYLSDYQRAQQSTVTSQPAQLQLNFS